MSCVAIVKEQKIDFILAGGGSVIDGVKFISELLIIMVIEILQKTNIN
jgi:alcohol dehydrogenase YqhD (iron-dependent ADH family)